MSLPDKDSFSGTFDGPHTDSRPVEDRSTEISATILDTALCDVAMLTHTAPRAWARILGQAGLSSVAIVDHDALWGSGTGVKPTCTQSGTGVYVFTWTASQDDELGESHALNIRKPRAWALGGATRADARVTSFTANTVTVQTYNDAGAANTLTGVIIFVEWA